MCGSPSSSSPTRRCRPSTACRRSWLEPSKIAATGSRRGMERSCWAVCASVESRKRFMPYRRCVAGMLLLGALAIRTPVALCQAPNNATLRVDRPVRQLNFLDEDNLACMLAGCRLQEWSIKEGKKKSGFAPALVSPPCFVHQKERDVFLIPHLSGALFEVKNGKLMKEHGERQPVATNSICVSRSGRLLAMGQREFKGDKYRVLILDTRTWEPIKALYGHDGNIASLSFSPDEKTLASTGWDDRLIVWDLERFK